MARNFSELAFTPSVRALQRRMGSRAGYAALDSPRAQRDALGPPEIEFIAAIDGFFQATVGANGWPYVQHPGGPPGFLKVLDERTVGYADFRGNRQYISVGNLQDDDRVSLILMDYAEQRRLKLWGRAKLVELANDEEGLIERLELPHYRARVERGVVIAIEAFDWNCPQHITPRFTRAQIAAETSKAALDAGGSGNAEPRGGAPTAAVPTELGNGPLALVVGGVRQLTPAIRGYELRAADGGELPAVSAGAHLDLPVRLPDGTMQTRRYSIASDPLQRDRYEVAVLREVNGSGGSSAVHAHYGVGLRLNVAVPGNDFALRHDGQPVVLVAGGIGITPLKAMAHELVARGTDFSLHYAARSERDFAFIEELRGMCGPRLHLYSSAGERLDLSSIVAAAPAGAAFYGCGPTRLIEELLSTAARLGVAPERVHYERFVAPAAADDRALVAELARSGRTVQVAAGQSILAAVHAAGIAVPAACRVGNCGTCTVKVLDGEPLHRDVVLTAQQRSAERKMCICVSRALGDRLELDL